MTPPDHVGDDPVPHAGGGSQGLSTARLTGLLNATYVQVTERPPTPQRHGAAGNGVTDDTAALAAFVAAGYSTGYVPPGVYLTSASVTPTTASSYEFAPGATVKASATITGGLWKTPIGNALKKKSLTGATFDCNNLADTGLNLRWFENFILDGVRVVNPTSHAILAHDATAPSTSFELLASNIHVDRGTVTTPGAVPSGSVGLWLKATDSELDKVIIQGQDIGIRVDTEANHFTDCHVWGYSGALPSRCFYDNSFRNVWMGCTADTPSQYGWYAAGQFTTFVGCRVFLVGYGTDNTVTGIYFNSGSPSYTLVGVMFAGVDSSHRLAKDVDGPSPAGTVVGCNSTNVVAQTIPFASQYDIVRMTQALTIHSTSATRALAVRNSTGANTTLAVDPTSATKRVLVGSGAQVAGFSDELTTETFRLDASKGTIRPRALTTTARNALTSLAAGDTVYDTTLGYLVSHDGTTWRNQAGTAV